MPHRLNIDVTLDDDRTVGGERRDEQPRSIVIRDPNGKIIGREKRPANHTK